MTIHQTIEVFIINAFTDEGSGGNPAGVVLNADHLSASQKLHIAQKVGLSETAFVSKSKIADFKLDFFTPVRQIPHCGHATIAVFSYLSQKGLINKKHSSKETIDGRREIFLEGESAYMEQKAPYYEQVDSYRSQILESIQLNESDLLKGAPILLANTGNSFVIIPVADTKHLEKLKPDFDSISTISEELDLIGFYLFCLNEKNSARDVSARMFAPRYGILEEAGTGMAAGPLACYLFDQLQLKKPRFLIEQGHFMNPPSPSLIAVNLEIENGSIQRLTAGGTAVVKGSKKVEIKL